MAPSLGWPQVQKQWGDPATCPPDYLLWFHHVPWTQTLNTGKTLWNELATRYYTGADSVQWMQQQWAQVQPAVDAELHADVASRLRIQQREALWWRDACVLYFQTYAKQPLPPTLTPPTRPLAEIKQLVDIYQLR
jgi:alpha-glucuronidase